MESRIKRHRGYAAQGKTPQIEAPKATGIVTEITAELNTKAGINTAAFTRKHGISENVLAAYIADFKERGYLVENTATGYRLDRIVRAETSSISFPWDGDKYVRFALLGDTQINSKYTQLTHLHSAYDVLHSEGIENVFHTGDIDEGEQMRAGHQYECYNQGSDDHVDEIVNVYPKRNGMTTHFITGNHDHSLIKLAGFNIGRSIAEKRSDMKFLGKDQAYINLTPNCKLELRHPGDGTAYAKSYKIQKMVEAMSGGEKPNMLAVGHYHKLDYDFYRNVHCFQTACLQAQTPFMRSRGIAAEMGFWLVELIVHDDGEISRVRQSFFPFYKAIPEDYKNFAGYRQ